VTDNRNAEHDLLIVGDAERAVVLCETFVEPNRRARESVVDEQVCVLVKDHRKGILLSSDFGGEGDVVDVLTRLKVSGDVWTRFEWPERAVALEHDHGRRHGRVERDIRKQVSECFAKLFELERNAPDVLLARVSQHQKVFSAHANPRVFRGHRGVLGNNDKKAQTTPPASGEAVVTAAADTTIDAAKNDRKAQTAPPASGGAVITLPATAVDAAKTDKPETAPQASGGANTMAPAVATTTASTTAVGIANTDEKTETASQAPVTTAIPDVSADKKPKK